MWRHLHVCDISVFGGERMKAPRLAFLATSFGFGPTSKAVSIAGAVRAICATSPQLAFFGSGIAYEFAERSSVFDCLLCHEVDDEGRWPSLRNELSSYDGVISVLNFHALSVWSQTLPPLVIVDSLAWLWPDLPDHMERARVYVVQDYLVSSERLRDWGARCRLETVGAIVSPTLSRLRGREQSSSGILVVNFSGCSNPLIGDEFYEDYVRIQASQILGAAGSLFDSVVVGVRAGMHSTIRRCAQVLGVDVEVDHYPYREFLGLLSRADKVLSSPGLTTTLECMALSTPIGFILPQNYSQALMAERNVLRLGVGRCLALSRFGPEYPVAPGLPEDEGVRLVTTALATILQDHTVVLGDFIRDLIANRWDRAEKEQLAEARGQEEVAMLIMSLCVG